MGGCYGWLEFTFEPDKRIHSKRQPDMANVGKNKHEPINHNNKNQFTEEETKEFLKRMNKDK